MEIIYQIIINLQLFDLQNKKKYIYILSIDLLSKKKYIARPEK